MLRTVIIENGKPEENKVSRLLENSSNEIQIQAILGSVTQSIKYFSEIREQDIIYADVQLPDGSAFEIFTRSVINSPVIFTTPYHKCIIDALEFSGFNYLLKPLNKMSLDKSLINHHAMPDHFLANRHSSLNVISYLNEKKKRRMIVRRGDENILIKPEDVSLFCTENKIVYAFDNSGKKYVVDRNLCELEHQLDPSVFFRINRQHIVNIEFIKSYRAFEKVKLQVELKTPRINHSVIVSKETASDFRKWVTGE